MKSVFIVLLLSLLCVAQDTTKKSPKIFEVPQADVYARYRYIDNNAGAVTSDDLQYRFTGRFRVNAPKIGTYFGSRVETGSSISSSWSNSGIGRSSSEWTLNAKTIFVGQQLGKKAAVEVGAMDMEQGAGSEATYADVDTWTEGYRLRVTNEGKYLPSKFTATFGFIGDFNTPNAFARLYRLGEMNYAQILAEKKFTKAIRASAEYDRLRGIDLFRAATKLSLPDSWWINDAQFENIVRVAPRATAGWAMNLVKTKNRLGWLNPGIYYSHLPTGVYKVGTQQALLNGDVYGTGKRIGFTTKYQTTKALDFSTLITRKLDSDPGFRWRAQIVARYQVAPLVQALFHGAGRSPATHY